MPKDRRFWLLVALLLVAAFWLRLGDFESTVRPDAVLIQDNDTLRWLAHLEARDRAPGYPLRETWDGFPEGSEIHWTLPMEWVLRVLDPLCHPFLPQARRYEAGAVLAGPILACVALLVFTVVAHALLGWLPALAAGAYYTLSNPISNVSWLGNGDHQNLQHLLLLVAVGAWLLRRQGLGARWLAAAAGAALGGAVWVSTESMAVLQLLMLASLCELCFLRPRAATLLADELARAGALTATLLLAQLLEQQSLLAVTWDKVSWFTSHQALVFLLFVLLSHRIRPWLAAALAILAGLLAVAAIPGYPATLKAELVRFAEVNTWVQTCVDEYVSAFSHQGELSWRAAVKRFTWLLPAMPLLLGACAFESRLARGVRSLLLLLAAGTLGLSAWENKLAHCFGMVAPLVVFLGARRLLGLLPEAVRPAAHAGFAGMAVALAALSLPDPRTEVLRGTEVAIHELCGELGRLAQGRGDAAVLAPWHLGAPLLYAARVPVVASGYHRNMQGIRDGYRAWLLPPQDHEVAAILRRHRVRWLVVWHDRRFLSVAPRIAGIDRPFLLLEGDRIRATDAALQSLYWRLRFPTAPLPGFRLAFQSQLEVTLRDTPPMPLFLVYEWLGG